MNDAMEYMSDTKAITGINIAPLVDVCLVLVIIFMVTAPFFSQPVLDVKLPEAHTAEGEKRENITITITSDKRLSVNEIETNWKGLPVLLEKKIKMNRDKFIIIRVDKKASHGEMLRAMDIAKICGARKLTIATQQKKSGV
ncbi:MAG: biopolymer transporter ExbD [bacterium]|nr:biopolymer transporter ExbD [bacterium]